MISLSYSVTFCTLLSTESLLVCFCFQGIFFPLYRTCSGQPVAQAGEATAGAQRAHPYARVHSSRPMPGRNSSRKSCHASVEVRLRVDIKHGGWVYSQKTATVGHDQSPPQSHYYHPVWPMSGGRGAWGANMNYDPAGAGRRMAWPGPFPREDHPPHAASVREHCPRRQGSLRAYEAGQPAGAACGGTGAPEAQCAERSRSLRSGAHCVAALTA